MTGEPPALVLLVHMAGSRLDNDRREPRVGLGPVRKGAQETARRPCGGPRKLKPWMVRAIRREWVPHSHGQHNSEGLATYYGVGIDTVKGILCWRAWKLLSPREDPCEWALRLRWETLMAVERLRDGPRKERLLEALKEK